MAYKEEPYKKLESKWSSFSFDLKRFINCVKKIDYDGYHRNYSYEPVVPWQPGATPEWNLEGFFAKEPETPRDLFLLPQTYPLLSVDALLVPLPVPKFPTLKDPPELVLEKSQYPEWYIQYIERDRLARLKVVEEVNEIRKLVSERKVAFEALFAETTATLAEVKSGLSTNTVSVGTQEKLIEIALRRHSVPPFVRTAYKVVVSPEQGIALIQFKFPDYSATQVVVGFKTGKKKEPKFASDAAKRKLIKQCLCSLLIRASYIAARFRVTEQFSSVVVNVDQDWFDLATGQPRSGVIASLQAPVSYLEALDLSKLDAEVAVKHLKAIMTPSVEMLSPVRPIFTLDTKDDRVVVSRDVSSEMDSEENLAAMEWEDFEHLVAQLFEWEFASGGAEVKVTRASRDRGVDALLFDPDPLRGGKYVIQAKRYTNTVDVSAVRDLYGTVMNEGANRGILITTASFGPDAYEFAKDKPISLVDGPNLIQMLIRHGKRYRIDIEEARRLNKLPS